MKRTLSSIAALLLIPVMLWSTACNQATIAALASTLGNAAATLATDEGNSTLAAKLKTDTAAAVAAINAWKKGTPATEVIEVLNVVEDDLNLFPVVSNYAPLVDLAIGTVESILALLPQPASTTTAPSVAVAHRSVTLAKPAPKTAKEFKQQWNALAPPTAQIK